MDENDQLLQLRAELAALEMVVTYVLTELARANPETERLILRGFDTAANVCEQLSIQMSERTQHFTLALERVEENRKAIKSHEVKRHGI